VTHNTVFTPVKLFTGIIYPSNTTLDDCLSGLETHFQNEIDTLSDTFTFTHSPYYEKEMGAPLSRRFVSFKTLVCPGSAYQFKELSCELEEQFSINQQRSFNIDPGIVSLHNLMLFSTKNYAHRVACQRGIYVEITSLFRSKKMQHLEWTYPDFKFKEIETFFLDLRKHYQHQLQAEYD
tara:strand:+ start:1475 stop:2011 length:537 start_codon:yes stop_codon:yes gene_type:complete